MRIRALTFLYLTSIILLRSVGNAQGVAVAPGASSPDPGAMLDVVSSDKGILIPRMSIFQRKSIIAPANGLLVFQNDDDSGFWYFGSDWTRLSTLAGSGTGNFLAKWTFPGIIGNSLLFDNGTRIGIGITSPASSALLDLTSTSRGFLPPRMTTAQRDQIASPAAGLTIYNTTVSGNETFNGTNWVGNTHYIGESYGGGIVFYVYDHGRHGLIAATADQSAGAKWSNGGGGSTGTAGDGLLAGIMNTDLIIIPEMLASPADPFAAKVCADYEVTVDGTTYADWYLPSSYELDLLFGQKTVVGGFASSTYWSSTEEDAASAWTQNFLTGARNFQQKVLVGRVRAIRAF